MIDNYDYPPLSHGLSFPCYDKNETELRRALLTRRPPVAQLISIMVGGTRTRLGRHDYFVFENMPTGEFFNCSALGIPLRGTGYFYRLTAVSRERGRVGD